MEETTEQDRPLTASAKFFGLLWVGTALLTVFTYWQGPLFLNLASSFRVQLLLALIFVSLPPIIFFPGRRKLMFLAVPAVISTTFLSHFIPQELGNGPEMSVAVANVYSGNRDLSKLKAWIDKDQPEVLGVLEVAPHHLDSLESLGYAFAVADPRSNNFGLALLSKETPSGYEVLERDTPFPSILAEYSTYRVLLTHPVPPLSGEARVTGDEQIERLSKLVSSSDKPTIVLGDLNATDWDRRVEPLKQSGLKNARQGFGILPTWPTDKAFMQIPIDHIYIPEYWAAKECETGPDIGSDHYPLRAVVILSR